MRISDWSSDVCSSDLLPRARMEDLKGDEPTANAAALRSVLNGAPGAFRDIVLMNAAAALGLADRAKDLREGVAMAAAAIDAIGRAAGRERGCQDVKTSVRTVPLKKQKHKYTTT